MKYMVTFSIPSHNIPAVLERWQKENPQPDEGARVVERWHNMGTGQGFTLMEGDAASVARYNLGWADLVEMDCVAVMDEQETAEAFS